MKLNRINTIIDHYKEYFALYSLSTLMYSRFTVVCQSFPFLISQERKLLQILLAQDRIQGVIKSIDHHTAEWRKESNLSI